MGISMDNINNYITNKITGTPTANKTTITMTKGGQFDEIFISSNKRDVEEKLMTEQMAKTVKVQVREETSEDKLNRLSQEIASGNYKINPEAIAEKMMLF